MNNTWLILDCDYLCHRARYTMGELSYKGKATGVIYGFLATVIHLMERFNTDKVAFCFDSRYSKRREIYPQYKANRKTRKPMTREEEAFERDFRQQVIKLRKEYLPEMGFKNVFMQKGYESDDLMAVICCDIQLLIDTLAVIVTADQDLFQCIRGTISVYNPQTKINMTLQRFYKTYNIEPQQWGAVKALAGCSSDNIPGARGIGETTALKFIRCMLKPESKAYKTIRQFCHSGEGYRIGGRLVYLPLPGTQTIRLLQDHISKEGWKSVCQSLGFKTLDLPNEIAHVHRR